MNNKAFKKIINNNNLLNNFKQRIDPTDVNIENKEIRNSQYDEFNEIDLKNLEEMGSNTVKQKNKNTRIIPSFSNFTSHRDPSLNTGMKPLAVQNMTILPNQLFRSLDLLAQTDELTISESNKNTNLQSEKNNETIANNEIVEPMEKIQGIAAPFIPYNEYENPTAFFDNYNNNGRNDIIKEYVCHINSIDRDITKYPNPFYFLVKFAPLAGDLNASISRTFMNIRYIKTETAVLPRKYYVNKSLISNVPEIVDLFSSFNSLSSNQIIDDTWVIVYTRSESDSNIQVINYTEYTNDISVTIDTAFECIKNLNTNTYTTYKYEISNLSLESDKYTILFINDINDVSQFSTDDTLSKAFNVLYPENIYGDSIYVDCHYAEKIYKYSELGNMSRMELRLTNSIGKQLTTNIKIQDFNVPTLNTTKCICSTDPLTGNIIRDFRCVCNYIRHPRYIKNQIDIMFKFGIVETDFDKRPFN